MVFGGQSIRKFAGWELLEQLTSTQSRQASLAQLESAQARARRPTGDCAFEFVWPTAEQVAIRMAKQ